jgi:hypothetical protein
MIKTTNTEDKSTQRLNNCDAGAENSPYFFDFRIN